MPTAGGETEVASSMPATGDQAAATSFRATAYVSCPSNELLVPLDERGKLIGSCPGCVAEAAAGVKRLKGRIRYRNLKAGGAK